MLSFRSFLLETGILQDLPPSHEVQTWILENRSTFHNEHGNEHGERLLFSAAWKNFNAINRRSDIKQSDRT